MKTALFLATALAAKPDYIALGPIFPTTPVGIPFAVFIRFVHVAPPSVDFHATIVGT